MGLYDKHILPRLLNAAMSAKPISYQRRKVVPRAQGRVLEIGFGAGQPSAIALPLPRKGKRPTLILRPLALAAASVMPTDATCGQQRCIELTGPNRSIGLIASSTVPCLETKPGIT